MATTQREERALLGHDAFKLIEPTHYPALGALSGEELRTLATRLREQHAKARDLIREGKRAKRGKGDARAAATAEAGKATRRKQVYAAALKRVNARFAEIDEDRRREANRAALKAALARKQAARAAHPQGGFTAGRGMRAKPSGRGHPGVNPGRIGSVSQQTRNNQARADG
jgi:hypothetical protein